MDFTHNRVLGNYLGEKQPPAAVAQSEMQRLMAASAVIEKLRKIVSSAVLPEEVEAESRLIIARAERAFGFPSIAERS